jgi:hypothetical protein
MLASIESKGLGLLAAVALLGLTSGCGSSETADTGGSALPPEVSVRPEHSGQWQVAGAASLVLEASGRLAITTPTSTITLAAEALELPAIGAGGKRVAFAARQPQGFGTTVAVAEHREGAWHGPRTLVSGGSPDRVAISPDGASIAYVASAEGIAALWIVPFAGGEPAQLTNIGVQKNGPGEPAGFVPVPHRAPPRFQGDHLVWDAPDGRHQVVLP